MADATIVDFPGITRLDISVDRVLARAGEAKLKTVLVIGIDEDGDEYFCSSAADGGTVLWLMERARYKLMKIADGEEP